LGRNIIFLPLKSKNQLIRRCKIYCILTERPGEVNKKIIGERQKMSNTNGIKVHLNLKAKPESKNEFMEFLHKNVPNVRAFEGCRSVKLYFDDATNEMIISEDWDSKKHHGDYIEFISENGVMKGLISYLQQEPSIKYYNMLNI
jgi:quinol monooxygenase YgiN